MLNKSLYGICLTKWLCSIALLAICTGSHGEEAQQISVEIHADKATYKLADEVALYVVLENRSRAPVYLYADLDWGESASLSLIVKDMSSGRELSPDFLFDALTPPPTSKQDFVKLLPEHVYGAVIRYKLKDLGINSQGTFQFLAEYHSPISANLNFGLPIWSRERGRIKSNTIKIAVENN